MYRLFWILVGALVASSVVQAFVFPTLPQSVDLAINLVIAATFGTFGTYWYYLHTCRQWRIAGASGTTGPDGLARRGGTRWWPVLIAVAVLGSLLYLASVAEPV
jgi:hypothetical protein